MKRFSQETMEALEKNQASLFVYFDFWSSPIRVHSGQGEIEWNGHRWTGVGDVLRQNSYSQSFAISVHSYSRGEMAASLPVNRETTEVLQKEYYRDRRMEWAKCAMSPDGRVIERVAFNRGRIVKYSRQEDVVTFMAEFDLLDSVDEKDARHKKRVEAVRQQSKWDVRETVSSSGSGWLLNWWSLVVGFQPLGVIVDFLSLCFSSRARKSMRQRWEARKRTFWFKTEPPIPGMRLGKNGYKIRADTLDEATGQLYARAVRRIWDFPREWLLMLVYVNDKSLEMFDLDSIRRRNNPKRWEETNPMKAWESTVNDIHS